MADLSTARKAPARSFPARVQLLPPAGAVRLRGAPASHDRGKVRLFGLNISEHCGRASRQAFGPLYALSRQHPTVGPGHRWRVINTQLAEALGASAPLDRLCEPPSSPLLGDRPRAECLNRRCPSICTCNLFPVGACTEPCSQTATSFVSAPAPPVSC